MLQKTLDFLKEKKLGIIGFGHLGKTLAKALIDNGFPKEKLLVSCRGRKSTIEEIKGLGLLDNLVDNDYICQNSGVIFVAVRPQNYKDLARHSFPKNALVVSFMAGVGLKSIKDAYGVVAYRAMPSGPDTIMKRKAIVALYPDNEILEELFTHLGMKVYKLPREELIHLFTVGVCLPAALLAAKDKSTVSDAISTLSKDFPEFEEIYEWAEEVLPSFNSEKEKRDYVARMSTKGGITEAIVTALYSGEDFLSALQKGVSRSKELSS